MIDVNPRSRCISRSRSCSDSAVCSSRSPVGSSASRIVGLHDQRARDGDALLLAAREHAGSMREPLAQADPFEEGGRATVALGRRPRAIRIGMPVFSRALNSGSR